MVQLGAKRERTGQRLADGVENLHVVIGEVTVSPLRTDEDDPVRMTGEAQHGRVAALVDAVHELPGRLLPEGLQAGQVTDPGSAAKRRSPDAIAVGVPRRPEARLSRTRRSAAACRRRSPASPPMISSPRSNCTTPIPASTSRMRSMPVGKRLPVVRRRGRRVRRRRRRAGPSRRFARACSKVFVPVTAPTVSGWWRIRH